MSHPGLTPCPMCGCQAPDVPGAHAVVAALRMDDVDRAFDAGLLQVVPCASCTQACTQLLLAARAERQGALAARERYRARQARLEERALARARARATPPAPTGGAPAPALPNAAAAALARARARAAQRHKP